MCSVELVFDKAQMVADLRKRLADTAPPPVVPTVAAAGVVPVLSPLDELLPQGGLPKGSVVSLQPDDHSAGLTSLLFTLLAGPSRPWSALVGFGDLGLAAAAELGVDLSRVVLVPQPGIDVLQILSVLIDGVDLIAVSAPEGPIGSPSRQRVLAGRLRQRGAVLLVVGPWPGADLSLTVSTTGWSGLGAGHGRLRDRELLVRLGGRRLGGSIPEVRMLLTGSRLGNRVLVQPALPMAERLVPVARAV
jgi:hypothetical protein